MSENYLVPSSGIRVCTEIYLTSPRLRHSSPKYRRRGRGVRFPEVIAPKRKALYERNPVLSVAKNDLSFLSRCKAKNIHD